MRSEDIGKNEENEEAVNTVNGFNPESKVENGNFENVGDEILSGEMFEDMPEVQEHVVTKFENEQEKEKQAQHEMGVKYPGFDSEIHVTDDDGVPIKNKGNGSYRKKRGAKKKVKSNTESSLNSSGLSDGPINPEQNDAGIAARGLVNSFYGLNTLVFQEDALPDGKEEDHAMLSVFTKFCRATGQKDLPWQVELPMILSGYYVKRFQKEKHQPKLKGIMATLTFQIKKFKLLFDKMRG